MSEAPETQSEEYPKGMPASAPEAPLRGMPELLRSVGNVLALIGASLAAPIIGEYQGRTAERGNKEMEHIVIDSNRRTLAERIEHLSNEKNGTTMSTPEGMKLIHQYSQLQQKQLKGEQYIREHRALPPDKWHKK